MKSGTFFSSGWYKEVDFNGLILQAGYKINPYFAVEVRNGIVGDGNTEVSHPQRGIRNLDTGFDGWRHKVKQMYPLAKADELIDVEIQSVSWCINCI